MSDFGRIRDTHLLNRFKAGDAGAFEEIYELHSGVVYRFALYLMQERSKAAELTQDTFVWLVQHPDRYDAGRGDLANFLLGVTRRLAQVKLAEERRWLKLDPQIAAAVRGQDEESDLARLKRSVKALPANYRDAVVLCDLEGQTYEEAAQVLKCSTGTVKSRLHRARKLLARKVHGSRCHA